jgi:membrane protease YdiL (CAAX protease family)
LAVVIISMLALFSFPRSYFVILTFISTGCMIIASLILGLPSRRPKVRMGALVIGLISAGLLYLVFLGSAATLDAFRPLGISSASEASIYSLISSPTNPLYLQVVLLLFDAAGYESFFRGVIQNRLQQRIGRGAAPAVALFDAGLHIATLNPLWVATTFVADVAWGLSYYYGKGVQASFTSHLLWDVAIFVIRPIT